MQIPTDEQILGRLIGIISDGFNRSLGALESAGAIETTKLRGHYNGIGSKYYDLVTEQMVMTARYAVPCVRELFYGSNEQPSARSFDKLSNQ